MSFFQQLQQQRRLFITTVQLTLHDDPGGDFSDEAADSPVEDVQLILKDVLRRQEPWLMDELVEVCADYLAHVNDIDFGYEAGRRDLYAAAAREVLSILPLPSRRKLELEIQRLRKDV